jgi:urea transport system permease protein
VAIGGRFTLAGAVLGAVLLGAAKTSLSEQFPSGWLYLEGALFILVMTLAPKGVAGLAGSLRDTLRRRASQGAQSVAAAPGGLSMKEPV